MLSLFVYGFHLDDRKPEPEEMQLASESRALVTRAWHDAEGRFLPLFVRASDEAWLEPVPSGRKPYGSLQSST